MQVLVWTIRNSLFPCLILFCSFLLDAWTLLRGFDCVTCHEVHHREASLVEETKGFGTRHVLIYQGWVLRYCGVQWWYVCVFFVAFCLRRRVLECRSFWQRSRSQVFFGVFFQFNGSYAIVSSHLFTTAWPSQKTAWCDFDYLFCFNCLSCL